MGAGMCSVKPTNPSVPRTTELVILGIGWVAGRPLLFCTHSYGADRVAVVSPKEWAGLSC